VNRLATESSPYLRQHADNPVDWHAWDDEALAEAKSRNVPILLSVGYASCHWCHVMAHESFEDEETATLMNEWFVNIKVDREERPDIDALYMDAVQAISGSGGWPMTVFLTPQGEPFFGGTYFPKTAMHGRVSFTELLQAIHDAWEDRQEEVLNDAQALTHALIHHAELADLESGTFALHTENAIDHARDLLLQNHDAEWGGFGTAPKFPQTHAISLLLWLGARGDDQARQAAITSLDAMASGGIYDHIGGGFARYSTDAFWMVPHFEKMLYDQAQFVRVYLEAYLLTGNINYRQVVEETIDYVLRELLSPDGAFYSSEDADSEGEEGAFYLWRQEEIEEVCGTNAAAVIDWYGVTKSGNFEARNILHRPERGKLIRTETIEAGRRALFDVRDKRERPGLDDKVLAEWNGLFIGPLADAGRTLGRVDYIESAGNALSLVLEKLRVNGELSRSWHSSSGAKHKAVANDYAALIDAATRVYEATGKLNWLGEAEKLAETLIDKFEDRDSGGFYTNSDRKLFARAKDAFDGATASANSLAANALLRLGALTTNDKYTQAAERTLNLLAEPAEKQPMGFTALAHALMLEKTGITEVVIPASSPELENIVNTTYAPRVVFAHGESDNNPLWESRQVGNAYICHNYMCEKPASSIDELRTQLSQNAY
jgi:uncharacterized protein YyaL (SSP411 family)